MIRVDQDTGFVVFALPRSRTAWLSRFLTYGPWRCGHDEIRHMRTLEDVGSWFSQPFIGTVETAGASWWRLLPRYAPRARIAVVRRPVDEVVDSLMRVEGMVFDRAILTRNMERAARKLDQLTARLPGVLSVDYADMETEATCARLFEHCTSLAHDNGHWAAWSPVNVQIDFMALARYAVAYQGALARLGNFAKQQTLAGMTMKAPPTAEGVTFQAETIDSWITDGQGLFERHCAIVGECPDQWRSKNWPLMRHLHDVGAMQIMTARCNGRMFGYLMTVISPSLTKQGLTMGANTTFFAAPEMPGLGLKLQRAAIQSLKARGVDEVFLEAGKRGDGERLGAMYRRLGAVDQGQLFRLNLTEA